MTTKRIASPLRDVTVSWARIQRPHDSKFTNAAICARCITTSAANNDDIETVPASMEQYALPIPFSEQTVHATIHRFPNLEPLRLQEYPANHLYLPTRRDILHRAVIYEGDMTRMGTASTKNRWEVRGSARKIRPQKGSGRARLGDKNSPMLRGGGVSHGPRPRDFSTKLPRKVYDLAWRTALSYRYRKGELIIVDDAIELESPSTIVLQHVFELHARTRGAGRSLLITEDSRPLLEMALNTMNRRRQALTWEEVDVKDLLELSRIIIERQALHKIFQHHRSDLSKDVEQALRPIWPVPTSIRAEPKELGAIPGWSGFRTLMQAAPPERDAVRAQVYADVAASRYEAAMQEADNIGTGLQVSAFALLAESKDIQRNLLPRHAALESEASRLNEVAAEAAHSAVTRVNALTAELRWRENVREDHLLAAESAEHRRDEYRLRQSSSEAEELMDPKVEEMQGLASEHRTELLSAETEVARTKKDLASAKADVAEEEGDMAAAETFRAEADAFAEEETTLLEEAEALRQEEELVEEEETVADPVEEQEEPEKKTST